MKIEFSKLVALWTQVYNKGKIKVIIKENKEKTNGNDWI